MELLGTLRNKASYMFSCKTGEKSMMFSIHTQPQPYGGGREPTEFLQRLSDEHHAWMSIDLPYGNNRKLSAEKALGDIYKVLSIFAFRPLARPI